jgi:uncharacterized repeat protein (TIGR01451 family)
MRANFSGWGAAAMLVIAALPLHAQQTGAEPVETTLEARKVLRAADGRETFASAELARPGDVLEYAATYRNKSRERVRNLEATLPIPPHTEYVPGSPRPSSVRASLDARAFSAPPLKRKALRDGREFDEQIPYRDYRYLRWAPVDLGPQATMTFTARVKVLE